MSGFYKSIFVSENFTIHCSLYAKLFTHSLHKFNSVQIKLDCRTGSFVSFSQYGIDKVASKQNFGY